MCIIQVFQTNLITNSPHCVCVVALLDSMDIEAISLTPSTGDPVLRENLIKILSFCEHVTFVQSIQKITRSHCAFWVVFKRMSYYRGMRRVLNFERGPLVGREIV